MGKEVTWGCQCAAAVGLSVLVPLVQPVRINTRFVGVPWLGAEGPADQGKASVVFVSAE